MTIRDDIFAVLRATGKPVQAKEIARVLGVSTPIVASHLGYLAKIGVVAKRTMAVGEPVSRGPYIFPESTAALWFVRGTYHPKIWRQISTDARLHKRLPVAVLPRDPQPRTDDMIQMLEDLRAALHGAMRFTGHIQ